MKKTTLAIAIMLISASNGALSQSDKDTLHINYQAQKYYKRAQQLTDKQRNQEAYLAIDKAVTLEPNNIQYLRTRGQIANEANKNDKMEESYARILKLKPDDEQAMYQHALAESWQDSKYDKAAADFQYYLKLYPNNKEAWISYANLENWRENHVAALGALENYRNRFGETKEYIHTKARTYALSGKFATAMDLNDQLLGSDPNNYDYIYTNVYALNKAHRTREALIEFEKLKRLKPTDDDTKEFQRTFNDLARSSATAGYTYFKDSQSVHITQVPIAIKKYIDPETSFIMEGLDEHLWVNQNSGLETVNGNTGISDLSAWAGFEHRFGPNFNVKGLAGALHIEDLEYNFIYLLNADIQVNENIALSVSNLRNLYRPYLVGTSPKSVSLGILEDLTTAHVIWQPDLVDSLDALLSYSVLTDGNTYTRFNAAPNRKYYINNQLRLTLGADVDLLSFSEPQLNDGYYDPKFHQEYLATAEILYVQNSKLSYILSGGYGTHRDQSTGGFHLADGAYVEAEYDINHTWQASVGGDYTYRGSISSPYHDYTAFVKIQAQFT